jgi:hypothetical protein
MIDPSTREWSAGRERLEAGRELDAEVAEKVFGWRWFLGPGHKAISFQPPLSDGWERPMFHPDSVDVTDRQTEYERFYDWDHCGRRDGRSGLPNYSTDIADAWEIVEHFSSAWFRLEDGWGAPAADRWICWLEQDWTEEDPAGQAPTAPMAICQAALYACERGRPKMPREELG